MSPKIGNIPWNKCKEYPQVTCQNCNKIFNIVPSRKNRAKYCSYSCRAKHRIEEKAPNFQGGQYKGGGYIYILKRNHPFQNCRGYVKRSNLVMEAYLGRYLRKGELTHHINRIKFDDRIENLKLFSSNSKHIAHCHLTS